MTAEIKINMVVPVRDRLVLACDLLNGELVVGMVLSSHHLKGSWEVLGLGFQTLNQLKNRRGITVKPSEYADALYEGVVLVSNQIDDAKPNESTEITVEYPDDV